MARIRTIKPEILTDSKTGSLSGDQLKMFIGILIHADDYGFIRHDILELKAKIFPYELRPPEDFITAIIDELCSRELIVLFDEKGKKYILVKNFERHQRVEKKGKPLLINFEALKLKLNQQIELFDEHSENVHGIGDEASTPEVGSSNSNRNSKKEKIKKENLDELTSVERDQFDRFWKAYPNKKSKGRAEKAWKAISPDEQLVARMCATIEQAKTSAQWQKDNGDYIPHPATWLRAKGWEDVYAQQETEGQKWLKRHEVANG